MDECPDEAQSIRMVIFDVEGVILPKQRYLLEEITLLNFRDQTLALIDGLIYEVGIRPLKQTLERIYRRFQGVSVEDFTQTFEKIPLIPTALETLHRLKTEGYLIALISSGVPKPLLETLAEKLKADFAVGPTLEIEENKLTGRIYGETLEPEGKKKAFNQVLDQASVPATACAVVADDRNNLPMFQPGALRIGFNPDFALATQSDYVLRGNLNELLQILLHRKQPATDSGTEAVNLREAIHIGSVAIPLMCQFLGIDRYIVSLMIMLVSIGYSMAEVVRINGGSAPPFTSLTQIAASGPEHWDYATAPLYLAAGVILCLTVFPPPSGYVGITVVTLGDGAAKIVGGRWGKTVIPFNKPKKVEGTIGGLVVSALFATLYTSPLRAVLAAGAGMIVEALPLPVNDNLLISVTASLSALIPI